MFYVRNDRMSLLEQASIGGFYEYPWTHLVKGREDGGAKLLVLFNRGAHYENDTVVLSALATAFAFVEAVAPKALVLWRTTQHGHPTSTPQLDEEFYAQPLAPGQDMAPEELAALPYAWGLFPAQSALTVELARQHFPNVLVLDTAPLLGLRRDFHIDGLHYGIPGPLDVVLETLLHFLPDMLALQDSRAAARAANATGG